MRKAFVSTSLNKDWPKWAAVIPGQQTKWFCTEHEAKVKVQEWNEDHPAPKVDAHLNQIDGSCDERWM